MKQTLTIRAAWLKLRPVAVPLPICSRGEVVAILRRAGRAARRQRAESNNAVRQNPGH